MVFSCGDDFFRDLEPLGVVDPAHVWPPEAGPAAERAFLREARSAWAELGAAFMAQWHPRDADDKVWALQAFGDPSEPLKNPRKLRR